MKNEIDLFLLAFTNKHDEVREEYRIIGSAYILLASMIDLQEKRIIAIEPNRKSPVGIEVTVLQDLPSQLSKLEDTVLNYLKSNPDFQKANLNADLLMNKKLFDMVQNQAQVDGLIESRQKQFLFFKSTQYSLTEKGKQSKNICIDGLRANLLEEGELDINTICLTMLLDKLDSLKQYFSEYEKSSIKDKINKLKDLNSTINTNIQNLSNYVSAMDDTLILVLGAVS